MKLFFELLYGKNITIARIHDNNIRTDCFIMNFLKDRKSNNIKNAADEKIINPIKLYDITKREIIKGIVTNNVFLFNIISPYSK